jgi:tetratricopeptide (TPR) repeat protein
VKGDARVWVQFLLVIILFTGSHAAVDPSVSYYKEGQAAYDRGDYSIAVDRLTEALIHSPRDKRISRLLLAAGQKLIDRNEFDRIPADDLQNIIDQAEQVIEGRRRDIRRALDQMKIAERSSQKRTPQDTLRACRGVDLVLDVTLGDDPYSQKFRDYLHSVCANLEAALHSGILVNPADENRVLGYVAFCQTEWDEAVRAWEKALKLQPKDSHLEALLVEARGRKRKAERSALIDRAILEAETAIIEKRDAEALALLQTAMKEVPGESRLILLYEKTQERVSRNARETLVAYHREKAIKAQRAGLWIEAAQSWLALLREDPLDAEAREQIERIRSQVSQRLVSIVNKEEIPPSGDATEASEKLYTLGLLSYADGDLEKASEHFQACLKINPEHAYAQKALERVNEEKRHSR